MDDEEKRKNFYAGERTYDAVSMVKLLVVKNIIVKHL